MQCEHHYPCSTAVLQYYPCSISVFGQVTDTVLKILSAKQSDSGRYRCRLRTGAGAILFSLTANLVVAERQSNTPLSPFDWDRAPRGRQPTMPSRYGDIQRSGQTQHQQSGALIKTHQNAQNFIYLP